MQRNQLTAVTSLLALAMVVSLVAAAPQGRDDKPEESCHLREIDLCMSSVMVLAQNSNSHPINNAEVNRQCNILNEVDGCFANYTQRCMTPNQADMFNMLSDGGLDTIRDLCKPQSKTRDSYLKHGDCINKEYKNLKSCVKDFQASLEKAIDITWQDRLKLGCCSYNRLNACLKDTIEPKCGADAYAMTKLFARAMFSRMPDITCAKYEHQSKSCAALLPAAGTQPKGAKSHSILSKLLSSYTNI